MLQVVPSQGFTVRPGSSYTLRIAVADANHGLVDSVLMVPAGAVRLTPQPMAVTGGPYAVASIRGTLRVMQLDMDNCAWRAIQPTWCQQLTASSSFVVDGDCKDPKQQWNSQSVRQW